MQIGLAASLTIATFIEMPTLLLSVREVLSTGRYLIKTLENSADFLDCVGSKKQEIDCLVVEASNFSSPAIEQMYDQGVVLPVVFLLAEGESLPARNVCYLSEVVLSTKEIATLEQAVEQAIAKFLSLTPIDPVAEVLAITLPDAEPDSNTFLLRQQRRLSEKLKERLGYLAVYYNRNPQHFFRYLTTTDRQRLALQLRESYRQIVLAYFTPESKINELLDEFVTLVFFADLSVSEVVEIHMDLMEEFAKQLKIEGWSEDILLDYRLTLIDVIAHLCELYRRSVPREGSR
jgi:circadian clock protein KaiA